MTCSFVFLTVSALCILVFIFSTNFYLYNSYTTDIKREEYLHRNSLSLGGFLLGLFSWASGFLFSPRYHPSNFLLISPTPDLGKWILFLAQSSSIFLYFWALSTYSLSLDLSSTVPSSDYTTLSHCPSDAFFPNS